MNTIKGGLLPLKADKRDLNLGALVILPDPKTIPDFYIEGGYTNEIQEEDNCSAFATMGASELQEETKLSRKFQFALSLAYSGTADGWGQDLRTAVLTPVKIGSISFDDEPAEIKNKPLSYTRYIEHWPDTKTLTEKSVRHKKKSAVFITPSQGMDYFNTTISSLYKYKDEKRAVMFGTLFDKPLSTPYFEGKPQGGTGHMMYFRGKKTIAGKIYLIAQNHFGKSAGVDGVHYFDRERVNSSVAKYGAAMYLDYDPEELKLLQSSGIRLDSPWIMVMMRNLLNRLVSTYKSLIDAKKTGAVPSPYLLIALIWQESGGDDRALGDNGNAFGCLQIWDSYFLDALGRKGARECLGNRTLSILVFNRYMARYATEKRLGRPVTDQDIARIHNGGPSGWKRPTTLVYWWQVQQKLKRLESGNVDPSFVKKLSVV